MWNVSNYKKGKKTKLKLKEVAFFRLAPVWVFFFFLNDFGCSQVSTTKQEIKKIKFFKEKKKWAKKPGIIRLGKWIVGPLPYFPLHIFLSRCFPFINSINPIPYKFCNIHSFIKRVYFILFRDWIISLLVFKLIFIIYI